MRRGSTVSLLVVLLPFVIDGWLAWAMPSNAVVVGAGNYASESESPFNDLTSADQSVSLIMEIEAPWEDFLMPSPVVVSLLGQLMVISSKVDFSLTDYAPRGGFKYVRHPESFRSSLVQVTNDGWEAFMAAHENMDEIRLLMKQIPIQVKTVMKILSKNNPTQAKSLLPIPLKKMHEMAQTSVDMAKTTEAKFADLMLLIGELLEASVSGKKGYQDDLTETQAALNATKQQKVVMDKLGEQLKNMTTQMNGQIKKLRKDYEKALADIPHGFLAFLEGIFKFLANIVSFGLASLNSNHGHSSGGASTTQNQVIDFATSFSFNIISHMFDDVGKMEDQVNRYFKGNQTMGIPKEMIKAFKVVLNTYKDSLEGTECDVSKEALGFIDTAKKIDDKLNKLMKTKPIDQVNQTSIMFQFDALLGSMKLAVAKAGVNSDGMYATKSVEYHQNDDDKFLDDDSVGANERYKAHLIFEELQHAEEERHQVFLQTMHYYEEMKALVGKLAHLNLEEIKFDQIVDLLKQSIELLGKIREQWSKLAQFFSKVSTRTEALMSQTMKPFLEFAEQAEKIFGDGDREDRQVFLKMLGEQTNDINKASYFLYTVSSTYVDVSTKYLLDRLAYLPKLLSAKDNERQNILQNLNKNLNQTQDAIMELARQKRQDYDQLMNARKSEIKTVIDKLGGFNGNDARIIENAYNGK